MTADEMKARADERRAILAARGIQVKIRATPRQERTLLETLTLERGGWIGLAADLNRSEAEVEAALARIAVLDERIAALQR
jgi:hypothetical protein